MEYEPELGRLMLAGDAIWDKTGYDREGSVKRVEQSKLCTRDLRASSYFLQSNQFTISVGLLID